MPYSGIDDKELPDNIKDKPAKVRRVFVSTFNATFKRCQEQDGDDCEARAMKFANSASERVEGGDMMRSNVLFIELESALVEGRAFDALVSGSYTDMLGREIEFKAGELTDFVANTQAAIDATKAESGEIVGLPIDARNHEHGNAAGWIVGVELAGGIIRVVPKWTEIGRELISKGIQRFFSASVDVANKVILGGTLTNWPATRDKAGRIQLRPIELSEQLREIVQSDDSQEVINMADKNTPEAVQPELLPAAPVATVDLAAMREQIKKELLAEFQVKTDGDDATKRLNEAVKLEAFADVADLSQAREEMLAQMQAALLSEYNRMQANAGNMLADMMRQIKRDQHIAEFSQRVVSGTEQRPYGLPVGQEEVETFLLSLNDKQREAAESILTRTHETGLVHFGELGHGKRINGTATLEPVYSSTLATWVSEGNSIREFFVINPELGEMGQYNLDEFRGDK